MSPITVHPNGGLTVTGEEGMRLFRMQHILMGLKLESKGMRLTARAPKCSTIVRREFGLKGNHAKLIEQFEKLVDEQSAKVTRIVVGDERRDVQEQFLRWRDGLPPKGGSR